LVVLHVQEAGDDDVAFLEADLRNRCAVQLNIPTHRTKVVTVVRSSASGETVSFKDACVACVASEKVDVVVLGSYGNTGARIGTLGTHAAWATTSLLGCTTVLASPYANPVPPLSQGSYTARTY
jgi:hypothetical protein